MTWLLHPLPGPRYRAPDLPASRTKGGRRGSPNSTYGGNVTEATRTADETPGAAVDVAAEGALG